MKRDVGTLSQKGRTNDKFENSKNSETSEMKSVTTVMVKLIALVWYIMLIVTQKFGVSEKAKRALWHNVPMSLVHGNNGMHIVT